MKTIESIPEMLGTNSKWVERNGAWWLPISAQDLRRVAGVMNIVHARFVTITVTQLAGDSGFRLDYHWDLEGKLLGFSFEISSKSLDSIFEICEAADWIEREVHEGFAIDFTGREYEPLLLRAGDVPGVNLREVAQ